MPRARKAPTVPTPGAGPADPRGGPRVGTPGKAYPNRSDLTAQAVTTAPNQAYGEAGAQQQAQKTVPMAGPPPQSNLATQAAAVAGGAPLDLGQGFVPPGSLGDPHGPTARPDEPLTHGLPMGPGAGPEVLPQMGPADDIGSLVARLAAQPGASQEMQYLAGYLKSGRR